MYDLGWLFGVDTRAFTFTSLNADVYDILLRGVLIGHLRKADGWEFYSVIPISFIDMQTLVKEIEIFLITKDGV